MRERMGRNRNASLSVHRVDGTGRCLPPTDGRIDPDGKEVVLKEKLWT